MAFQHHFLRGLIAFLAVVAVVFGFLIWRGFNGIERIKEKAVAGDAQAQYTLAVAYDNGKGIEQDLAKAVSWYRRAATQGHLRAQHNLGISYENGDGVEKDILEALKWYQQAAAQGDASSQYNIGLLYSFGQGPIRRNDVEALQWFRLAAEQGHAKAQSNLGAIYALGLGTDKDLIQAYKWFTLSAAAFPPGEDREQELGNGDKAAASLAPAQLELAKKLIEEWAPTPGEKKAQDGG